MDLTFTTAQTDLLARVASALADVPNTGFQPVAIERLRAAGVPDLALDARPDDVLAATLAVTEAARLGVLAPVGLSALVLPLFPGLPAGAIGALSTAAAGPVVARYGCHADVLIRIDGTTASVFAVDPAGATVADAEFVYPLGFVALPTGAAIASAPAAAVLRRSRIALAAELVGILDSLLTRLKTFLSGRRQFGRPLAGFQAIHHRLSEMAIELESCRWLARQAAWLDDDGAAATAAGFTCRIARRHCLEAHQLAGARGFTLELGLGHDTMRLHYLSTEHGGAKAHEADAFRATWPVGA